jgi:hypothetical protein
MGAHTVKNDDGANGMLKCEVLESYLWSLMK